MRWVHVWLTGASERLLRHFFASSPFLIWYSQEARYITLAVTTSLLSMYLFHRVLFTESLKFWFVYTLATAMALFAFVPNIFVVMAQGIYIFCSGRRDQILRWLSCQAVLMLVFGSWLMITYGGFGLRNETTPLVAQIGRANVATLDTGTPRELSAAVVPYTFFVFSAGFSIGPSVQELHISRDLASLLEDGPILAVPTLLFGSLFLFGIVQLFRQTAMPGLLLLWVATPILGVLAIAATTNVAYNVRYTCAAMPAFILIIAAGIAKARGRSIQRILLLAVLSVNVWSLSQYYFNPRYVKADARAAARYLESVGNSRDMILMVGNAATLRHYYKGNLPVINWGKDITSKPEMVSQSVKGLSKRYERLWLVAIRPWETDPKGNVKAVLDESLENLHAVALPGVEISSYVAKLPRPRAQVNSP